MTSGRRALIGQIGRFLGVGGVCYVIDTGVFNLLLVAGTDPIVAKGLSTVVAIVGSYIGNRCFTFRERSVSASRRALLGEMVMFAAVNVAAGGIAVACLWVSRSVLGFDGLIADNVAANVVGVGLGMAVRFVLYRLVVFRTATENVNTAADAIVRTTSSQLPLATVAHRDVAVTARR